MIGGYNYIQNHTLRYSLARSLWQTLGRTGTANCICAIACRRITGVAFTACLCLDMQSSTKCLLFARLGTHAHAGVSPRPHEHAHILFGTLLASAATRTLAHGRFPLVTIFAFASLFSAFAVGDARSAAVRRALQGRAARQDGQGRRQERRRRGRRRARRGGAGVADVAATARGEAALRRPARAMDARRRSGAVEAGAQGR
eukprot:6204807-Pleurochrysis_carterae.AAC.3